LQLGASLHAQQSGDSVHCGHVFCFSKPVLFVVLLDSRPRIQHSVGLTLALASLRAVVQAHTTPKHHHVSLVGVLHCSWLSIFNPPFPGFYFYANPNPKKTLIYYIRHLHTPLSSLLEVDGRYRACSPRRQPLPFPTVHQKWRSGCGIWEKHNTKSEYCLITIRQQIFE
jgi:hypothetical protein